MDVIKIEVLEDGTIKAESGQVSQQNHQTAEAFLRNIAQAGGTKQERKHKQGFVGGLIHAAQHALGGHHHHHH